MEVVNNSCVTDIVLSALLERRESRPSYADPGEDWAFFETQLARLDTEKLVSRSQSQERKKETSIDPCLLNRRSR